MQEYDFTIVDQKGSVVNTNGDALPVCAYTVALPYYSLPELKEAQIQDPIISIVQCMELVIAHGIEVPS